MSKKEVEFKGEMNLAEAKGYLETLLAGLNQGTICVRKGDECLVLTPAETVKLEIEAKEKKDKAKFSLELSWKRDESAGGEELTTSTDQPVEEKKEIRTEEPPKTE